MTSKTPSLNRIASKRLVYDTGFQASVEFLCEATSDLMFSGRGDGGLHDHFADKLILPIRVIFALSARGALSPILRALLVFRRRTLNPKP